MNYPQIMSPCPLCSKSGGHVPQLLWERRPCVYLAFLTTRCLPKSDAEIEIAVD